MLWELKRIQQQNTNAVQEWPCPFCAIVVLGNQKHTTAANKRFELFWYCSVFLFLK